MAIAINMPQVGQDIDFARIIEWHVREGDEVKEGDILATVESDKASFEVEASESGIVLQLLFKKGDEAVVFKPIAYIGQKGENILDEKDKRESPVENSEVEEDISSDGKEELRPEALFSSPSARRLARENNLKLSEIAGSGPDGRIIKKDVEAILKHAKSAILKEIPGDQVILFNRARKRAAERLSFSKLTIPHYYLFSDVDVSTIVNWRKTTNSRLGSSISINDIIIKSVAEGLRKFPEMNSWVDDEKILLKPEINIGIAVSTPAGLLVPVIPDADKLNLTEINIQSRKNTEDARKGLINIKKPGTFTVTNLGMYGISRFLPIINPPECAILSAGAVEKKAVPKDSDIVIIDCITLGLACDHRAVDGNKASEFLSYLKEIMELFSS